MSGAMERGGSGQLAKGTGAAADLAPCPAELRKPLAKFWGTVQVLFPSPMPLAFLVGLWVREYDLHPDDAAASLAALSAPGALAGFRFASEVTAELGRLCDLATTRRKAAEAERRRAESRKLEDEASKAGASRDANAVRDLLAAWRERNGGK